MRQPLKLITAHPLRMVLIAYVLLALVYSVTTPIFEASDELWHYPMVKYIADHGIIALPYQQPGAETTWRQEGSQPPLYYMLSAALTFWIDTSDLPALRRINPHADIGVVLPDGNLNMTIQDPDARRFPWHGAALAVMIARFLSIALGTITVWMTYRLAAELLPKASGPHWLAITAAAFTAFNPMFLFISSSVNNDNLSNALASTLLVLIVRLLKRTDQPSIRELIGLGVLAGAGMLAKFNIGFLLPIIGLALALLAIRLRNVRFFLTGAIITGSLTILIAGWWYIRNMQLYGDPTGLNVFIQIVGPRAIPANWAQLWAERHTFLMSYWGFFGGVNLPLPELPYSIFNLFGLLAVIGLGVEAARWLISKKRFDRDSVALLLGRGVIILWIVVLFISLLRWTSETWASQGRLMFSAIAPISLGLAVGLWALGNLVPGVRGRLAGVVIVYFLAMALFSAWTIRRAYALEDTGSDSAAQPVSGIFSDPANPSATLEVSAPTSFQPAAPQVGEYVQFCPQLRIGADLAFSRDWSVFIHFENSAGVIVAQRDVYLRGGLLATGLAPKLMAPQSRWTNCFAVHMPDYAYAPQRLDVYLGFYDIKTGQRMAVTLPGGRLSTDQRVRLGTVSLQARPSTVATALPNPVRVNLGDQAELVGYDMTPNTLLTQPGQQVTVTLYWRALRPTAVDYRVFVQIVEPYTTHVFGQSDAMPAEWTRPTSTWKTDEIIADKHTFTIPADAKLDTWQLVVGMYRLVEAPTGNQFQRLRIITPDGGQADDFIGLTRVKIEPPDVVF